MADDGVTVEQRKACRASEPSKKKKKKDGSETEPDKFTEKEMKSRWGKNPAGSEEKASANLPY